MALENPIWRSRTGVDLGQSYLGARLGLKPGKCVVFSVAPGLTLSQRIRKQGQRVMIFSFKTSRQAVSTLHCALNPILRRRVAVPHLFLLRRLSRDTTETRVDAQPAFNFLLHLLRTRYTCQREIDRACTVANTYCATKSCTAISVVHLSHVWNEMDFQS